MRLSKEQILTIKKIFKNRFSDGDSLWLFGSRTDDTKKGGDIDLYIETYQIDTTKTLEKKIDFLCDLKKNLGDQKIDVIINHLLQKKSLPVYGEAKDAGILLMTKKSRLLSVINTLQIHAKRLEENLAEVLKFTPINADELYGLKMPESSYLEVVNSRFCKMQDDLGAKIFPMILEIKGKDANTFIDKLNMLEKLEYLNDAQAWIKARELRNEITHDYQDDYELLADHTNKLVQEAQKLIVFWQELKPKLTPLIPDQTS